MMPHACVRCHTSQAATRTDSVSRPAGRPPFTLVKNAADQHISGTCSRQLRKRRDFLAAVRFMLKARYHPAANTTTLLLARDFAHRMCHSKDGHVLYGLAGVQKRLGLSRSTVTKHTRILRELGLLAFVEHGSSRRNALRTRLGNRFGPGMGFRRTATIYAPCAPPEWDRARGRLRDGAGYTSRVCAVTPAGREQAIEDARRTQTRRKAARTPSCVVVNHDGPVPVSGLSSKDNTARRASSPARKQAAVHTGPGPAKLSPAEAAAAIGYAQQVRLQVWWAQGSCVRQVAYALRPLIGAGFTWQETARELSRWHVPLRPRSVIGYVHSEIRRRANTGLLVLPDGCVRPYRQVSVDDRGERYEQMLAHRRERSAPAFARYRQTLAGRLRTALRQRPVSPSGPTPQWTPAWREPEVAFYATLPTEFIQATPRDIYLRRAMGRSLPIPDPARASSTDDETLWQSLADHAAAAAACERLRKELEEQQHGQRHTSWRDSRSWP